MLNLRQSIDYAMVNLYRIGVAKLTSMGNFNLYTHAITWEFIVFNCDDLLNTIFVDLHNFAATGLETDPKASIYIDYKITDTDIIVFLMEEGNPVPLKSESYTMVVK